MVGKEAGTAGVVMDVRVPRKPTSLRNKGSAKSYTTLTMTLSVCDRLSLMSASLTTEELLQRVRTLTRDLSFNQRIDAQLSERTVRWLAQMGYITRPERRHGRSVWTEDHVRQLVHIRRAQSEGKTLKEIMESEESTSSYSSATWKSANQPRQMPELLTRFSSEPIDMARLDTSVVLSQLTTRRQEPRQDGWSIALSANVFLNGFTSRRPTTTEIKQVRDALSELLENNGKQEEDEL